ncbi:MAG: hypothetical protein QG635_448 [Bacteroidota bacterium]|nr:hypothetical protein [Bacteroidota bacterium]
MRNNYIIVIIIKSILFIICNTTAIAQKTGSFEEGINVDDKIVAVSYYVPESYDGAKSYPLVIGMSPGGGPGGMIRGMLMPAAKDLNIILACPDFYTDNIKMLDTCLSVVKSKYNIDASKVIMTGYSAGGAAVFPFGVDNPDKILGVIGIAASIGGVNYQNVENRGFAIICGNMDSHCAALKYLGESIEDNGGGCLFIEKDSVGHIDPYYSSYEFLDDWKKCFYYIVNFPSLEPINPVSPDDGIYAPPEPVKLVWNKVGSAVNYQVNLIDLKTVVRTENTSDTSIILNDLISNKSYYWKVMYIDKDSNFRWSKKRSFKTKAAIPIIKPDIIEPLDGVLADMLHVKFNWTHNIEADRYQFQLSKDLFSTFVINDTAVKSIFSTTVWYSVLNLDSASRYFWRVRGINIAGYGPWTDTYSFTTQGYITYIEDGFLEHYAFSFNPNPAGDYLCITGNEKVGEFEFEIFSIEGIEVMTGKTFSCIEIQGLIPGVYYLKIRNRIFGFIKN